MDVYERITESIHHFHTTGESAPGWPNKEYSFYALIGQMDWLKELHRLIWDWEG
jgi:hypothetical protein